MSTLLTTLGPTRNSAIALGLRCAVCCRLESTAAGAKAPPVSVATPAAPAIQATKPPPQSAAKATYNPYLMGDEPKEDFFPKEFHEQLKNHPKLKDNKFYQRLMDDREKLWGFF